MFVNFTGSTNKGPEVQLYKNGSWSENQGIVLVKYNNKWNFVNGSDWNYTDAMVVCRELGKYLYIQDQCIHKLRQKEFQLQVEQDTVAANKRVYLWQICYTVFTTYNSLWAKVSFDNNLNFGDNIQVATRIAYLCRFWWSGRISQQQY